MALVAMEEPAHFLSPDAGAAIRDAKVNVIRQIEPIDITNVVVSLVFKSKYDNLCRLWFNPTFSLCCCK